MRILKLLTDCALQVAFNFVDDDGDGLGAPPSQTQEDVVGTHTRHVDDPGLVDAYAHSEEVLDAACSPCGADDSSSAPLNFVDDYAVEGDAAPTELPYWRCEYCNIHTPAAVVKCVATGKWFCNHKPSGLPASCIVYHLVKSKNSEVMLHKESPLGEITLECFISGAKNVFQVSLPTFRPH